MLTTLFNALTAWLWLPDEAVTVEYSTSEDVTLCLEILP